MTVGLLQVDAPLRSVAAKHSYDRWRQSVLVVLCLLWFIPGITGRAPWKPIETSMVPAVAESAAHNTLLVPRLLGTPYLELPPIPAYVAAAAARIFAPPLLQYEAMRLGNILWLGLGLLLAGLSVGWLHGSRVGWRAVLLLAGSPGLLLHSRTVNPDLTLLALAACGLIGLLLQTTRPLAGRVVLGLTAALGLWVCGTIALWYVFLLVLLPVALRPAQFRWRAQAGVLAVLLLGLASLGLWLLVLAASDPTLPAQVGQQQLKTLSPVALAISLQQSISSAVWVLWPALPFAALAVVGMRSRQRFPPEMRASLLALAAGALAILGTGSSHDSDMFLLLPLTAAVAAVSVTGMTREIAKAMDWFAIIVIGGGLIGFFWLTWLLVQTSFAPALLAWLASHGISPPRPSWSAAAALLATLLWVGLMLRIGRSPERSVLNWMAGTTMGWWVFTLLWLPAVDAAKSYTAVATELGAALDGQPCVRAEQVNISVLAQLEYFSGHQLSAAAAECKLLLVPQHTIAGEVLWTGGRPGDRDNDRLQLVRVQ